MRQQASVRQPDETICLRCGQLIKRDVTLCPECGTRIAAGPEHAVAASSYDVARPATRTATRREVVEDEAGAGRYILNFLLAGIIGLILTFFLRRQGWLATWICIPILIVVAFFAFSTYGSSP